MPSEAAKSKWLNWLRYLRLATTVLCLIACAHLIALWVRSYTNADFVHGDLPGSQFLHLRSFQGSIHFYVVESKRDHEWNVWSHSARRTKAPRDEPWWVFGRRDPKGHFWVAFPHWFAALIVAVIAAIPWVRRFSLRTLLVAMMLLAIILSAAMFATR